MTSFPFNFRCEAYQPTSNSVPVFSNYFIQPQFPSLVYTAGSHYQFAQRDSAPLSTDCKMVHNMPPLHNSPPVAIDEKCGTDGADPKEGQNIPVICGVRLKKDESTPLAHQDIVDSVIIDNNIKSSSSSSITGKYEGEHQPLNTGRDDERNVENPSESICSQIVPTSNVESITVFSCTVCYKVFTKKEHLCRHERTHSGEKPYTCDTCKKSFTRKEHLQRHSSTHTGEKLFCCEICTKYFSRKEHLKRHFLIHMNEKPFQCDKCSIFFTRKSHLDRHLLTHTEEKPFMCVMCEKSFRRKVKLDKHSAVHSDAGISSSDKHQANSQSSALNTEKSSVVDVDKSASVQIEASSSYTDLEKSSNQSIIHSEAEFSSVGS